MATHRSISQRTTALLVALVAVGSLLLTAGPAAAGHRETEYCSETGDVCFGTFVRNGIRKFKVVSFHDFSPFKVCVVGPQGPRDCHRTELTDDNDDGVYEAVLRWRYWFPYQGPGEYTFLLRNDGERLGPKLGFHAKSSKA